MSTHLHTFDPVRGDLTETVSGPGTAGHPSRAWAVAGIGAGVLAIGTVVTSSMVGAVYDDKLNGDAPAILHRLSEQTSAMFAFHTITALGALLTVVYAAGLAARLRAVAADSIAPTIAFAGLLGTAVVSILGSGLDTEFMNTLASDPKALVPESAVMYNHWIGTIPWLFTLAGLSGLATYVVSRRGGVPRWIGRVGLVLGGLAVLAGVSPMEYMAVVPASR